VNVEIMIFFYVVFSEEIMVCIENAERKNVERKKRRKNKVDIYFSVLFFLSAVSM
jgi:hypothetical protein